MTTFSEVKAVSPIPTQPFIWMAEYFTEGLTEFDLDTGKENSFKNIDKDKLLRFGLIGNNHKMWFECVGGSFNIVGRRIDIAFETKKGKRYNLTGNGGLLIKDIITFKKATADIDIKMGQSVPTTGSPIPKVVGYYYGYKTQMTIDDINFSFKPIVSLPLSKAAFIEVNLMADKDMDGKIIFIKNHQDVQSFCGILKKDKISRINWIIK